MGMSLRYAEPRGAFNMQSFVCVGCQSVCMCVCVTEVSSPVCVCVRAWDWTLVDSAECIHCIDWESNPRSTSWADLGSNCADGISYKTVRDTHENPSNLGYKMSYHWQIEARPTQPREG